MTDWRQPNVARIATVLCASLLGVSFMLPYAGMDAFVPVLWKPIPPFGSVTPTASLIFAAVWAWRASLVACLIMPGRALPLAAATALGFFCLGLRSCFMLQPQLFATLELSMVCLFAFAAMGGDRDERGRELAFAIKLVIVLLFFSAGLAKVRFGGIGWAFSGVIERSVRMLYPMNRDTLGMTLALRRALAGSPTALRIGAAASHILELAMPLALFSKRGSRLLFAGIVLFICSNLVLLGINFYTLIPMLIIWGVWDVTVAELPRRAAIAVVGGALVTSQLAVTLISTSNMWPVMLNDMYARPSAFPAVETIDFALIGKDGVARTLEPDMFRPFSRFHLSIALLRKKERHERDAVMARLLETCAEPECTDAAGIVVNWKLEGARQEELARYTRDATAMANTVSPTEQSSP